MLPERLVRYGSGLGRGSRRTKAEVSATSICGHVAPSYASLTRPLDPPPARTRRVELPAASRAAALPTTAHGFTVHTRLTVVGWQRSPCGRCETLLIFNQPEVVISHAISRYRNHTGQQIASLVTRLRRLLAPDNWAGKGQPACLLAASLVTGLAILLCGLRERMLVGLNRSRSSCG